MVNEGCRISINTKTNFVVHAQQYIDVECNVIKLTNQLGGSAVQKKIGWICMEGNG